jgi:hypothetical protein
VNVLRLVKNEMIAAGELSARGVRIFEIFEFEFANIRRIRILEIGLKFVESNFALATNSNTNRILCSVEYSRIFVQNSFMIKGVI